jgi:hypothetical protein
MPKTYPVVGTQWSDVPEQFVADLKAGTPVLLVRQPDNPKDANAIAIYVEGKRIGYVPRNQNKVLAQFIDQQGDEVNVATGIAQDGALTSVVQRGIPATFVRSPNSGFPMVEVP